jgi:DNA-binding NarL/FixJ family response regulator
MAAERALKTLTVRETEVAHLLAEGKSNKDVARLLDISVRTVETHRAHILSKLNIRSTTQLVRLLLLD